MTITVKKIDPLEVPRGIDPTYIYRAYLAPSFPNAPDWIASYGNSASDALEELAEQLDYGERYHKVLCHIEGHKIIKDPGEQGPSMGQKACERCALMFNPDGTVDGPSIFIKSSN